MMTGGLWFNYAMTSINKETTGIEFGSEVTITTGLSLMQLHHSDNSSGLIILISPLQRIITAKYSVLKRYG